MNLIQSTKVHSTPNILHCSVQSNDVAVSHDVTQESETGMDWIWNSGWFFDFYVTRALPHWPDKALGCLWVLGCEESVEANGSARLTSTLKKFLVPYCTVLVRSSFLVIIYASVLRHMALSRTLSTSGYYCGCCELFIARRTVLWRFPSALVAQLRTGIGEKKFVTGMWLMRESRRAADIALTFQETRVLCSRRRFF